MAPQGCLLGPWVNGQEMGDPRTPLSRGDPGGHRTDPGESDKRGSGESGERREIQARRQPVREGWRDESPGEDSERGDWGEGWGSGT